MAKNKDNSENAVAEVPIGYLTLKEASERTEYTPDYIGQLIRAGKIEGKQVYSNVAWVANESSLRNYLELKGKESRLSSSPQTLVQEFPNLIRPLLYAVIAFAAVLLVVFVHVLSVTIDRAIASALQDETSTSIEISNNGIVKKP